MKITYVTYGDLSVDEKYRQPNNGSGKEEANYLKVDYENGTVHIFSDAMEPEDATFSRNLGWIKDVILKAYFLGYNEAS